MTEEERRGDEMKIMFPTLINAYTGQARLGI
jgi:hypothetical protein